MDKKIVKEYLKPEMKSYKVCTQKALADSCPSNLFYCECVSEVCDDDSCDANCSFHPRN